MLINLILKNKEKYKVKEVLGSAMVSLKRLVELIFASFLSRIFNNDWNKCYLCTYLYLLSRKRCAQRLILKKDTQPRLFSPGLIWSLGLIR